MAARKVAKKAKSSDTASSVAPVVESKSENLNFLPVVESPPLAPAAAPI